MNRTCLLAVLAAQLVIAQNPLFTESSLPYHLPPFAAIKDEHFAPAFEKGMAEELAEVDAIANNPAEPTFDNTIVALERSGQLLERARDAFSVLTSNLTNPVLDRVDGDFSPRFAEHRNKIRLNAALFDRIHKLYERRDSLKLDAESKKLLEDTHRDYIRAGAALSPEGKDKMRAINADLARLSTQFKQNVTSEVNASAVLFEKREELAGLAPGAMENAAGLAKSMGAEGKFAIRLTNTTGQPPLEVLTNADTRARIMQASLVRGTRGNEFDNRAVVIAIARLRAELAELLGYPNYAAFGLETQTAGSMDAVNSLLTRVVPAAMTNARAEAAELQKIAGATRITSTNWAYYTEKLREQRFAFDASQLRPYYEMRRVLVDGVFYAATRLYGITFKERKDLAGFSPDNMIYEVFDADGKPLGLFLGDFYARPNKRGGAWNTAYVTQSKLTGYRPVTAINLNVPKPPAGEPSLLTFDEVTTMFHEFGHALHTLFSDIQYPSLSDTPRDFVEFPSQVNEMWATWPEIMKNYAVHYKTGEPMPAELVAKVTASAQFNEGFATTEYIASAVLDLAWHSVKPDQLPDDVASFEANVFKANGIDASLVPPRYRSTYFSHVFSGGYQAGYYSYIWSEILDADTVEWFKQNGGLKRENGDKFRKMVLAPRNTQEMKEMYRNFRGAEPDVNPLLQRRGLMQ
jgi:peptidyl-dipeptidase Dcp